MMSFLMSYRTLPVILAIAAIPAANAATPALDRQFEQTVKPFVTKYCYGCHSGQMPAAQFDLKAYTSMDMVARDYPRWALVMQRLTAQEMPPKPMPPPPAEARQHVIDWIQALRAEEIKKSAGDPGLVLARRLSNAEYNYTVRDLTGQDMQITREFPVDPANPAGFDNSGESLTMSPALLKKYLQAAREVADHMVLTPDGIDFAPYPMLVETDRDKYPIQRIVSFYAHQPTDFADYFQAAWRFKYRAALGEPHATLATIAADSKVSAKYLPMVWQILEENEPGGEVGPIAKLQGMFRALPAPGNGASQPGMSQADALRAKCVEMRDFAVKIRTHTAMQFAAPVVRGLPAGSQPLLNWKLYAFAAHRRESDPKDLLKIPTKPRPSPKFRNIPASIRKRLRAGPLSRQKPAPAIPIWWFQPPSAAAMKPRSHASLRFSQTAFTSRSAAATSRTIPRTRGAC
jgi:hypothetical protein